MIHTQARKIDWTRKDSQHFDTADEVVPINYHVALWAVHLDDLAQGDHAVRPMDQISAVPSIVLVVINSPSDIPFILGLSPPSPFDLLRIAEQQRHINDIITVVENSANYL